MRNRASVIVASGFVVASAAGLCIAAWQLWNPRKAGSHLRQAYAKQQRPLSVGSQRKAVDALQQAIRADKERADLWSDLAVALHELGRLENDPGTIVEALVATDRALRLEPNRPEAILHRAAILDSLDLTDDAALARRHYLALDGNSQWADAARESLAQHHAERKVRPQWSVARPRLETAALQGDLRVVEEIIRAFPYEARHFADRELAVFWGQAELDGRYDDATRFLMTAEVVAKRLVAINGEGLPLAATNAIRAALGAGDGRALAEAYVAYGQARTLIQDRKSTNAEPLLILAERGFAATGSPMILAARFYRAKVIFDQRRTEEALALLDATEAELKPEFQWVRAQCQMERSRILTRTGKRYESLQLNVAAARNFLRLGEVVSAGRNQVEIASRLTWLGRSEEAWRIRRQAFELARRTGSGNLLQMALYTAARDELAMGHDDVARSLFALIRAPYESVAIQFDTLLWRSYLAIQADHRHDVDAALAELRAALEKVEDPAFRADAEDQMKVAEAMLIRKTAPPRALELLTDAIAFRQTAGRPARVAEAYIERGRTHADLRQNAAAEQDFDAALDALEGQRAEVRRTDLRDAFFDVARAACDELLSLQTSRSAFGEAFQTIERCRARSVLDGVGRQAGESVQPLSYEDVRRRLDERTIVAAYAAAGRQMLLLVITARGLEAIPLPHHPDDVARRATDVVSALTRHDRRQLQQQTRDLYDALIAPIERQLNGATTLVVVSDESVAALPFAVLADAGDRRLIERVEIIVAPSASAYARRLSRQPPPLTSDARALVIADPAFDEVTGFDLPRLSHAREEARQVAQSYREPSVLADDTATASRFLEEIGSADLVHVATHAVLHPRSASSSFLLLAPDGKGHNGLLTLPTIANLHLTRSPLVVLAGCETGVSGAGRGSLRSLASAFLAAGSRGVVGTLWSVEDEVTASFSVALHRHLREQSRLSAAVRAAQLEMMKSSDPHLRDPLAWGAFVSYGS